MSKEERNILLEFCRDYYEEADCDEDELRDYNEAIKETDNLRIKHELEALKERYNEESKSMSASYIYEEQLDYIDSQTAGLSEHITHADIGRWDGHHVHDEETEESYTLKEAVEQMSGCDDVQIYTEDGEVYLRGIHHDGENIYRWGHKMAAKVEKLLYGE